MSHDLPDDWYEEHDGQRLVLSSAKVAAGIAAAVADERERCAQIAEKWDGLDNVAAQIRQTP